MSLTPDPYFKGNPNCACCGKPMGVNDAGITYHGTVTAKDLLFCVQCVGPMLRSLAKDLVCITPEIAFTERFSEYDTDRAKILQLEATATALQNLAVSMCSWAECQRLSISWHEK